MEILLAEDSPIQGVMIRRLLEQQGCKVTLATNGREALRLAGEKAFDLIFMDCNMPEMDGYEATRQIRAREGSSAALRIVGMSAEESEKTRAGCLAAGMNDCISKLAGPKELQRALEAQIHECPSQPASKLEASGPVDFEAFRESTDGSREGLRQLAELYVRQVSDLLDQLRAALAKGDLGEVRRLGHKAVGSSAMCGVVGMVPLFRAIERFGEERNLEEARGVFPKAESTFKSARAALKRYS